MIPKAWIYNRLVDWLVQHGYPNMTFELVYELAPELYEIAKKEIPELSIEYPVFF